MVVMGVSGSGKSTLGERLAKTLRLPFADADDFHPPENVRKMSAGAPLDDADRAPWLAAMADWLTARAREGEGGVLVCSALKRRYRDRLRQASPRLFFIHLDGPEELIRERMAHREGHFMPASLLRSQFADLEPLQEDERGAAVPIEGPPHATEQAALAALARAGERP
ncbi:gluconokinase [Streptomyces boncukensis]|uniref:Gluconokinase n=1 Tax=Streptomyces boncukensis TaxID=2711219 RepID=A0A6G4WYC1_9ACTN|nr:gluconokinase [Streptomyces boncukensis]NGO70108.1 gluconokinase [Streptomyces boncukensis]